MSMRELDRLKVVEVVIEQHLVMRQQDAIAIRPSSPGRCPRYDVTVSRRTGDGCILTAKDLATRIDLRTRPGSPTRVPRPVSATKLVGRSGMERAIGVVTVKMSAIPFGTTNWSQVDRVEYPGERGAAYWRTQTFGTIRVRMVEYTPGYLADHWCSKGHILLCLEGELHTELKDGRSFTLLPGMSYQVADDTEPHRSSTDVGAKLFIVD